MAYKAGFRITLQYAFKVLKTGSERAFGWCMGYFLEVNKDGNAEFGGEGVHPPKLWTCRGDMRFQFAEASGILAGNPR